MVVDSYNKIKNHRTLAIKIENIIHCDLNLKWEIYSYLTIFSENFLSYEENKAYYKPEEICLDYFEHKFSITQNDLLKKKLKDYYKGDYSILKKLSEEIKIKNLKNELDFLKM